MKLLIIHEFINNYYTVEEKILMALKITILVIILTTTISNIQAGFRKGRGTRDQIANICWTIKKQESSRETSISALLSMPKPLTVWITTNYGKFWKRWAYPTTCPASWEICMQVRKQQLEMDKEKQTGSKSGKEYIESIYCHSAYLTYMQSTSCEMPAGWSTSWNQDFWEKYQ